MTTVTVTATAIATEHGRSSDFEVIGIHKKVIHVALAAVLGGDLENFASRYLSRCRGVCFWVPGPALLLPARSDVVDAHHSGMTDTLRASAVCWTHGTFRAHYERAHAKRTSKQSAVDSNSRAGHARTHACTHVPVVTALLLVQEYAKPATSPADSTSEICVAATVKPSRATESASAWNTICGSVKNAWWMEYARHTLSMDAPARRERTFGARIWDCYRPPKRGEHRHRTRRVGQPYRG
jgi:hypothetical protein